MNNKEMRIKELKELLSQVKNKESFAYLQGLHSLKSEYETGGYIEEASEVAGEIIHLLVDLGYEYNEVHNNRINDILVHAYDTRARGGDFRAYCIALEWNRARDKKFYIPRMRVLEKHGVMNLFQDLQDDKLDLAVLNLPPRIGKALSDDTPILTRKGWKKHGDLVVGDEVLNNKGDFVKVLAISQKCNMEYKVIFSNGEEIMCHGNHEWLVHDSNIHKDIIITTKDIINNLHKNSGKNRYFINEKKPIVGEYTTLKVHPYVLGAWLGDGSNRQPRITGDKKDINIINKIINCGYKLQNKWIDKRNGVITYSFENLSKDLKNYNMCYDDKRTIKHIPDEYFTASLEQRLELLAGLLDTDGYLLKNRARYSFATAEEQLKDDFISLVSTFGWRCSVTKKKKRDNLKNSTGRPILGIHQYYEISFNCTLYIPCVLERKQLSFTSSRAGKRISIKNIEVINEEKKGNCIQVEGGIYLAGRQLIPTHNSTISLFFLTFRAGLYPDQSILGNAHSTSLTQSFYNEFIEIISSDEYRYNEIFPSVTVVNKNSEYSYLDMNTRKRFHTVMFRAVDAGTTGLAEASNLLYCDDLVKDVETANNKDRLDKLYYTYTSTIKDRKVPRKCKDGVYRPCPELHVNTPWSIYDVTNRIIRNEESKGNNDRVRVISVPCWNENHESNFMYEEGKGFDVQYYEDMQLAEDPVIFSAKYLMKCIERDGRPFERDNLTYYTELPGDEPDKIVAYNDVSHGGEDYMSMPVAYVYGLEVYIVDVLFKNDFGGDGVSRLWVRDKIIQHHVSRCGFEKNNGGDFYSTLVDKDLKNVGYRCNITAHNAPTRQRKLDRILACRNPILGLGNDLGDDYKIYFKDPSLLPNKCEYRDFLNNLWNWSQKEGSIQQKQHDDAPDSLAGLLTNVLGRRGKGTVKVMDIGTIGY